jgi:hypothetical protein
LTKQLAYIAPALTGNSASIRDAPFTCDIIRAKDACGDALQKQLESLKGESELPR